MNTMLLARQLACVRGERQLFRETSFGLAAGELLRVEGHNGVGKTSLLRMLAGLSTAAAGDILWQDTPIARLGGAYRRQMCYLGHLNAIKEELTPLENLLTSAGLEEVDSQHSLSSSAAEAALSQLGLLSRADLACKYLSQGQKRRVALSRLAHEKRPLWILDEPFVALDTAAVAWLAECIGRHLQCGGLVVLTTHQAVAIPGVSSQVLKLGGASC